MTDHISELKALPETQKPDWIKAGIGKEGVIFECRNQKCRRCGKVWVKGYNL